MDEMEFTEAAVRQCGRAAQRHALSKNPARQCYIRSGYMVRLAQHMCKEVGAFPKCQCPNFVAPDSTPGVMTWPELLDRVDNHTKVTPHHTTPLTFVDTFSQTSDMFHSKMTKMTNHVTFRFQKKTIAQDLI